MFNNETVVSIISTLSSLDNIEDNRLIWYIVNLIKEKGRFFFVGLYMIDRNKEYATIKAGTTPYGEKLVEREHRLRIQSEENLLNPISYAIWINQLFLYDCYSPSHITYSPLFPETQWELVLPLRVNNQVVGALEIDGDTRVSFHEEDIYEFQKVADEVSRLLAKYDLI